MKISRRIEYCTTRGFDRKRSEVFVLFIRNRFRDLKLIVQVTRSVNYRSIIHRVPNYDPKE